MLHVKSEVSLIKQWELNTCVSTPESVVYDCNRECLYVSNYNDKTGFRNRKDTLYDEYISKVDLKGNIIKERWIDNMFGPTGMKIHNDTLLVVELGFLTKINIDKQEIIERFSIRNAIFLNDIEVDEKGKIYLSDSKKEGAIYKVENRQYEVWYQDTLIQNCNGLLIDGDNLIVGNRGTNNLVSISLSNKKTKLITSQIATGIDGLKKFQQTYIGSWQYKVVHIDKSGNAYELLDTSTQKDWNADFELIESKNLIIMPTLLTNKVIAYQIITTN